MTDLSELGPPPTPTRVVANPEFDNWVERAAILLCVQAHEADGIPCLDHLHQARQEAHTVRLRISDPRQPTSKER
jgi:hypothetical protein